MFNYSVILDGIHNETILLYQHYLWPKTKYNILLRECHKIVYEIIFKKFYPNCLISILLSQTGYFDIQMKKTDFAR